MGKLCPPSEDSTPLSARLLGQATIPHLLFKEFHFTEKFLTPMHTSYHRRVPGNIFLDQQLQEPQNRQRLGDAWCRLFFFVPCWWKTGWKLQHSTYTKHRTPCDLTAGHLPLVQRGPIKAHHAQAFGTRYFPADVRKSPKHFRERAARKCKMVAWQQTRLLSAIEETFTKMCWCEDTYNYG